PACWISTYHPSFSGLVVQAWSFSGGPPSYRLAAPRPSDPAPPGIGSARSLIHARFRLAISRVPFARNLLSHRGSLGDVRSVACMKRVISPVPSVISRGKGAAGYSPRIDGLHDGAIGRRMGTAKSSQEKNEACGRLASQTRFAMRADAGI